MAVDAHAQLLSATVKVSVAGKFTLAGVGAGSSLVFDGVAPTTLGTTSAISTESNTSPVEVSGVVQVNQQGDALDVVVEICENSASGTVVGSTGAHVPAVNGAYAVPFCVFYDPGDVGGLVYVIVIAPD